jgi:glutamate-1-semialdehyde 2,1-aminomutase
VPYNDLEVLKKLFAARPGQIAAVVVEPIAANMGVVLPSKGYLAGIRELCDEFGALLIIDEVITGFRLCFGGVCEMFGVKADIVCLGKIAGGGMPLAAFAARTEIMDRLAPLGDVYQAGTLSGNPVAVAAAITTLDILSEENIYPKLDALGAKLQEGLKNAADKSNIDLQINRAGSLLGVFFTNKPVNNFNDVKAADIGRFKRYFAAMLDRGIYLAPSAYESMFISAAHSEADIDRTIEAAGEVFSELSLA